MIAEPGQDERARLFEQFAEPKGHPGEDGQKDQNSEHRPLSKCVAALSGRRLAIGGAAPLGTTRAKGCQDLLLPRMFKASVKTALAAISASTRACIALAQAAVTARAGSGNVARSLKAAARLPW